MNKKINTFNTNQTIPQIGNSGLADNVISVINTPKHRVELARIMDVGEQSIIQYLKKNDPKLTQIAPLTYIKNVMGCLEYSELLA